MTIYDQIRNRASELEPDIANFLIELVKLPSFSGKEKDVINVIRNKMLELKFDDIRIDGMGNIIGRIGNGPRVVAFDAHVDVVYPGDETQWQRDPFDARIIDGYVFGRGTSDQKGGLASMIYAAKIINELALNHDFSVYFTGTVQEEDCDGLCWQYLINEEKLVPELVVITEPTSLKIHRGQRGRMEINVSVKGVSCHGSAPERGDNAIYKMARIALEIEQLNERLHHDPFLGKGTVTISQIRSGSPSLCAVADQADIHLDRRLTYGETKDSAVAEVKDAAARAGYPDAEVTVLNYDEPAYTGLVYPTEKYYPTWVLDEKSSYLNQAADAYRSVLGEQPVIDKWTFSTNAVAIAGMHNIPCLGLGPGHERSAHAVNETVPVDHLSKAAAFYAAFVARLNGA
ncbi:YgeY family selenium metabolism-linked hydrolase [candidate division KSB1 bacterium]|nr:YgeY family selenium metabolism-linked hydrolase [candidate division KSB1 bacterium]